MAIPAKITSPMAKGILPRARLFRKLEKGHPRLITWITSPPGAGKTSLVASFLGHHDHPHLWYQMDAGDGDPATLFRYLRVAVEAAFRRRTPPLPVFGAEYSQGVAVFARRFFEALFARMPEGAFLVLDDYHELPVDAPAHEVLREGFAVIPCGIRVIVLSRQAPPPAFARLLTNGHMDGMEWADLRMSPGEARALLRKHAPRGFSQRDAATMLQLADGWPVGLVLLATGYRAELALPAPLASQDRDLLFSYFASEVLDRMEPDRKVLLLKTSLLPKCSAGQAEKITGLRQAEQHFRSLAKTGYLVVEHGRAEPMFEFHPLFRAFLSHRASEILEPGEWNQLRIRSAALLEEEGQLHEAFELLRAAGDPALLIRMILVHAPALLSQGQNRTLAHWLEALPEETIREKGWLSLWMGLCRMSSDLMGSRSHLEVAFERFLQLDDVPGQMLAWAAVVDGYCTAGTTTPTWMSGSSGWTSTCPGSRRCAKPTSWSPFP